MFYFRKDRVVYLFCNWWEIHARILQWEHQERCVLTWNYLAFHSIALCHGADLIGALFSHNECSIHQYRSNSLAFRHILLSFEPLLLPRASISQIYQCDTVLFRSHQTFSLLSRLPIRFHTLRHLSSKWMQLHIDDNCANSWRYLWV